ncbi:hypothetical protein A0H81_12675 [Grifola frondosa]|uniref:Uncharacterized protein n=1 Tax=Grifola frondosa TaxID=5627 RepID=A0A1C7LRH0_GRIFR|nr:hypothetical protein A0H81_12675 [Grifola frondosa]
MFIPRVQSHNSPRLYPPTSMTPAVYIGVKKQNDEDSTRIELCEYSRDFVTMRSQVTAIWPEQFDVPHINLPAIQNIGFKFLEVFTGAEAHATELIGVGISNELAWNYAYDMLTARFNPFGNVSMAQIGVLEVYPLTDPTFDVQEYSGDFTNQWLRTLPPSGEHPAASEISWDPMASY